MRLSNKSVDPLKQKKGTEGLNFNPSVPFFGTVPVFIAVTRHEDERAKRQIAIRATLTSAAILTFFVKACVGSDHVNALIRYANQFKIARFLSLNGAF